MKKLYKSRTHKMLDGVCAGLGDYFKVDPTVVRVVYAAITVLTGIVPGIILYVALAIIMPRDES